MDDQRTAAPCIDCGMDDPPPDPTCYAGRDHNVGITRGCPACGRLPGVCARRPCPAMQQ